MGYTVISLFTLLIYLKLCINLVIKLKSQHIVNDSTINYFPSLFENIPFTYPSLSLCFGTPQKQCFNLIISTIASFTLIENKFSIQKIFNSQFNPLLSLTFNGTVRQSIFGYNMKHYYIQGNISEDFINFSSESKITSESRFHFVLMNSSHIQNNLRINGFIGMQKYYSRNIVLYHKMFSFVDYLLNSSLINHRIYALSYDNTGGGYVIFGEEFESFNQCDSSIGTLYPGRWNCYIEQINFGNQTIELNGHSIIEFNSMSHFIEAPYVEGGRIIQDTIMNLSKSNCFVKGDGFKSIIICNKNVIFDLFPDIILRMNTTELILKWKNMFKKGINDNDDIHVSLFIVNHDEMNVWKIGIPGFIDNTIVFNYITKKIGIKHDLFLEKDNYYFIWLIFLLILLFIGLCFNIIVKKVLINNL